MHYQSTFKRYELKYLITKGQKEKIISEISPYMKMDSYGKTSIRNIYYDTENYLLIRNSIEGPAYKEKLRLRSYGQARLGSNVYIEIKKKYDAVVYKRRIGLAYDEAVKYMARKQKLSKAGQISEEIDYFCNFYKNLKPAVYLSYDREAFFRIENFEDDIQANLEGDLRITFDENILWRNEDISLEGENYGHAILEDGMCLMEIKTSSSIPLWLCKILSQEMIYKTSFSKYGEAYKQMTTVKTQINEKEGKQYA